MGRERYEVLELLGEGATGVVYRATDGERDLALKVLRTADPVAQKRFAREARLARESRSRHLVEILDVGDDYLVMPFYAGGSLATRVPLDLTTTIRIAAELAHGLDALHARGVIHRDVKPSNVLLGADGTAVLSDFGLARGADSTQLTREGQLVGSLHYLAPELIEGAPAAPAGDIYALGCLLYECVAGKPPFAGRGDAEIGYAHLVETPVAWPEQPELSAAVLTALSKSPQKRPTTATALARMLHLAGMHARA